MDDLIAVTGATGVVGGGVARRLADRGIAQRLVVRDPARAPRLPGADVRGASAYGAGDEMRAALEGAGTLFLVPAEESTDRVDQHRTAVDAAVEAGVRRIVYLSFLDAAPDSTFTLARDHWATEQHIRAAGVAFTFPRMSLYLDFVPLMAGADGVIAGPAGDGRAAVVTRADVADVVAALADLVRPRRAGARRHRAGGAEPRRDRRDPGRRVGQADRLPRRDARRGARVARPLRRARVAGRGLDQHLHGDRGGRARDRVGHGRSGWPGTRRRRSPSTSGRTRTRSTTSSAGGANVALQISVHRSSTLLSAPKDRIAAPMPTARSGERSPI